MYACDLFLYTRLRSEVISHMGISEAFGFSFTSLGGI